MADDGWVMMMKRLESRRWWLEADERVIQSDVQVTDDWMKRSGETVTRDADELVMTCEHLRSLICY